jgi:hypothetical protein
MHYKVLSQGFVRQSEPRETGLIAVQPRTTVTRDGDILCTYVQQAKLGTNDFQPMLARSRDGGNTWVEQPLWPHLWKEWSIIGNMSTATNGDVYFFGARTRIEKPGQPFWCDATQGMLPNDLLWARSRDGGRTWGEPTVAPVPIPCSAEATSPMVVTRQGTWVSSIAPYNTWDLKLVVKRNQVVAVWSEDESRTWRHSAMMQFPHAESTAAGHSVVELSDGRVLGVTWHINETFPQPPSNAYSLSEDGGRTWGPTLETGILGQSTGLAALPDGRVLLVYNQRKHGEHGIWLAVARPTGTNFGIEANEIIWRADVPTQGKTSGEHSSWTDFAFGAPSVVVLPDGIWLVTLWCIQPSGSGVRYVKVQPNLR